MKSLLLCALLFFSVGFCNQLAIAITQCSELLQPHSVKKQAYPSVVILGIVKDRNGDSFIRMKKVLEADSWLSSFSPRGFDRQGNPFWAVVVLGPHLARILGFDWTIKNELLVPTADTLNKRISAFNKFLVTKGISPIEVQFYSQEKLSLSQYLFRFGSALALPIASSLDHHTVHDFSFHVSSIQLPKSFLTIIQSLSYAAAEWGRNQTIHSAAKKFEQNMVYEIDSFTSFGNVDRFDSQGNAFLDHFISSYGVYDPIPFEEYASRFTPLDLIHRKIQEQANYENFRPQNPIEEIKFLRQRELGKNQKAKLIRKLRREHPEWNITLAEMGLGTRELIYEVATRRRVELQSAAKEFLNNSSMAD